MPTAVTSPVRSTGRTAAPFPNADTLHGAARLTEAVQRIMDRLVFMRVIEDREIVAYGALREMLERIGTEGGERCESLTAKFNEYDRGEELRKPLVPQTVSEKGSTVLNGTNHNDLADNEQLLLDELSLRGNLDDVIPQLARDVRAIARVESVVRRRHTEHELILNDSRGASHLPENSIHLVVTSPPYWTLKRYNESDDQLGHVADTMHLLKRSMRSGSTAIAPLFPADGSS